MRATLQGVPGIEAINLDKYQEILVERFSNALVADTLMRVAQDTSNKFSIQVGCLRCCCDRLDACCSCSCGRASG